MITASFTSIASLDRLPQMLDFVRSHILSAAFTETVAVNIEIAVEEALVNIIKHGYGSKQGMVEIVSQRDSNGLCITIRDQGILFNPLEVKKNESNSEGVGLILMNKLMDKIEYRCEEDCNVLVMFKKK